MTQVSIIGCGSYERAVVSAAVRCAVDAAGGMARFVKPGARVLLKPNLLAARDPAQAVTTHPEVVRAVAELVKEAGGVVTIADSPGGPFTAGMLKSVYAATGMAAVAEELGIALNADFTETEVASPRGMLLRRLRLISTVANADVVINLPKLKTHGQMVFTGAVKNMFGAIAGTEKIEYHMRMADYAVFADAIIDVCLATRPALTIMDAVVAMEGAGPSAGEPKEVGLLLAGDDPFAVDYVALNVVGANPLQVPVMKAASLRGLCPASMDDVAVVGKPLAEARVKQFDMPGLEAMLVVGWSGGRVMRWIGERAKPRPVFHHDLCNACGICTRHCPAKVISMDCPGSKRSAGGSSAGGKPRVNLNGCIRCFCCQELCPQKAITIKRLGRRTATVMRIVYFVFGMIGSRLGGRSKPPRDRAK